MRERLDQPVLDGIKANMSALEQIWDDVASHWTYEDGIYRLYHQSFKVYYMQEATEQMVRAFQSILPGTVELNADFMQIVKDGTGKEFDMSHNKDWLKHTRPIVEAFLHAKYFLEMMIKYGKTLETAPHSLASGWASVLYLYNTR